MILQNNNRRNQNLKTPHKEIEVCFHISSAGVKLHGSIEITGEIKEGKKTY